MYRLLLPVEPNAQRHFDDETGPSDNFWSRVWSSLRRALSGVKSPHA